MVADFLSISSKKSDEALIATHISEATGCAMILIVCVCCVTVSSLGRLIGSAPPCEAVTRADSLIFKPAAGGGAVSVSLSMGTYPSAPGIVEDGLIVIDSSATGKTV